MWWCSACQWYSSTVTCSCILVVHYLLPGCKVIYTYGTKTIVVDVYRNTSSLSFISYIGVLSKCWLCIVLKRIKVFFILLLRSRNVDKSLALNTSRKILKMLSITQSKMILQTVNSLLAGWRIFCLHSPRK